MTGGRGNSGRLLGLSIIVDSRVHTPSFKAKVAMKTIHQDMVDYLKPCFALLR